jgi:hypothetical protein
VDRELAQNILGHRNIETQAVEVDKGSLEGKLLDRSTNRSGQGLDIKNQAHRSFHLLGEEKQEFGDKERMSHYP